MNLGREVAAAVPFKSRQGKNSSKLCWVMPVALTGQYQRLQILTVEDLLADKKLEYPRRRVETFNKAERKRKKPLPTQGLLL